MAYALILILLAFPAAADPVSISALAVAAASSYGVASAAAIGVALGISATAAAVGVVVAGSLVTLGLNMLFAPKAPRPPELIRDLAQVQGLQPYRHVYGRFKVYGSPAPWEVKGGILYGCLILNSRPSKGGVVEIAIDKTPVEYSGSLTDFSTGASATNSPFTGYAKFWLGLGDQASPPAQILAEAGELFQESDGWRGRTVLWLRLDAGPSRDRGDRWKRVPPDIEVTADWSLVWDPRDTSQDPDDAATWRWSNTRALIVLDALRTNPARPYPLAQIDVASFTAAANSDDAPSPLAAGGTEPRWRADGLLSFSGGEIEALVAPIADAGGSPLVRIGGQVALALGEWSAPEATITDLIGDELTFEIWTPGRDLASVVNCKYVAPDRDWEMADLAPWIAPDADGDATAVDMELTWVTSATQAMRLQKIRGMTLRKQRRLTSTLPPSTLAMASSSTATLALPSPYARMNGAYQVVRIAPVVNLAGDGVALRCPAELVETGPEIWAWNPAEDEQPIVDGVAVTLDRPTVTPPAPPLILTSGASTALDTGGGVQPRILARWTPTLSGRAIGYEVQQRLVGMDWQSAGGVDIAVVDGDGYTSMFIGPVTVGAQYEVRVRASAAGAFSAWIAATITANGPDVTLTAPTGGSAVGGANQIAISFFAANDAEFVAIEFWGADVDDSASATLLATINGVPNTLYGFTETGLGSAVTRYYFARANGPFGARSAFSASATATTDI